MKKPIPKVETIYFVSGFTLIEIIIVSAIIVVLLSILLSAITSARKLAQQGSCSGILSNIGQLMHLYCTEYNDWLPGSPNTSGNGANPGGSRIRVKGGWYYPQDYADKIPATHIFDWAGPLASISTTLPSDVTAKYKLVNAEMFKCPTNKRIAKVNHSRIQEKTFTPSFATSRFFMYVHTSKQTGTSAGSLFYSADFTPKYYLPKITSIESPSSKLFLADACKVDRSNPAKINNWDYGFTTYGAWLNEDDIYSDHPSLSYRFEPARTDAFRHRGGINILFFDGHVGWFIEGSESDSNGFGSGARTAKFWFPSETDTSLFPSHWSISNNPIVVP